MRMVELLVETRQSDSRRLNQVKQCQSPTREWQIYRRQMLVLMISQIHECIIVRAECREERIGSHVGVYLSTDLLDNSRPTLLRPHCKVDDTHQAPSFPKR